MNEKNILVISLVGNEQDRALVAEGVRLAQQIGGEVVALALTQDAAYPCLCAGASHVVILPYAGADDLALAKTLADYCKKQPFWAVLSNATVRGRGVMPMVAALLETGLTADCTSLEVDEDGTLIQIRPAFGSNVLARIICTTRPQMATVRPGIYPPAAFAPTPIVPPAFEMLTPPKEERVTLLAHGMDSLTNTLATAEVIVAGGMGVGSKEGFIRLSAFAKRIGAGLGCTRSVVNAGWAPYACQVGQTGIVVRPKLYIAVGISGAVQHLVGMSGAGTVFAVNMDAKAPIFHYADYAVVGDWKAAWSQVEVFL